MKQSSSVLILLTASTISLAACASVEPRPDPEISIFQSWAPDGGYSWVHPLGNCAHWEADVAIRECTKKLEGGLYPRSDRVQAYALRASAYVVAGDFKLALADYEEALRLEPENAELRDITAWLRATAPAETVRDGAQAIVDALVAVEQEPKNPTYLDTLAAAYAENGDFENAVEVQQSAIELTKVGDHNELDALRSRLALYSSHMPYRDPLAGFVPNIWYDGYRSSMSGQRIPVATLPARPVAEPSGEESGR